MDIVNRNVAPVLLALVVGVGVGYLLGRSRAPEGRAVRRIAPVTSAEPVEHEAPVGLTEILRDLPAPAVPVGTGTIAGLVRTKDGRPLAGVLVRATLQRPGGGPQRTTGAPQDESVEAQVTRFIERVQWERGSRRETKSQ